MRKVKFENPFRPGSGHMPPYLAGRENEKQHFRLLLRQEPILKNAILTGLRGVGKTVLLESFKPIAFSENWLWVGTDLSESASISEENIALRLLADLSVVTSSMTVAIPQKRGIGFNASAESTRRSTDFSYLRDLYLETPGLISDKLKHVLENVWRVVRASGKRGIIFAYDEAQNLSDHAQRMEYPVSTLLDVFQSLQRKNIPFMLTLTGLPALFSKLVESRTYSERMFETIVLNQLNENDSKEAIMTPIKRQKCPFPFSEESVNTIINISGGYPYFIQFICREVYDTFLQQYSAGKKLSVPIEAIVRKLDSDFFAARWGRATDRQRELLYVIASIDDGNSEFTVQEITEKSKNLLDKPFSNSHANQMLVTLADMGFVYKDRHGKYLFAVPLLSKFILRQSIRGLKE